MNTAAAIEADLEEIQRVVATVEHAMRQGLPEEFAGLFRADAVVTTAHGKLLTGRDEISAFTHQALAGPPPASTATYEVAHVLFIRPDVAAVKIRQRPVTRDGRPIEDRREGTPLYVMAREDGRWLLVATQNTEVLAP